MSEAIVRPWEAEAERLLAAGISMSQVGARFGVSKSVIKGVASRRGWETSPPTHEAPIRTTADRLDALHARLDAVLAETRGIPRVKPAGRVMRVPR